MPEHLFPVRVQRTAGRIARAYGRGQSFDVGSQASLREADAQPSAVEYVLGALGGDLVCGLERAAEGQGIPLHADRDHAQRPSRQRPHASRRRRRAGPSRLRRNRGHGLRRLGRRGRSDPAGVAADPRPIAAVPHTFAMCFGHHCTEGNAMTSCASAPLRHLRPLLPLRPLNES